MKIESKLREYEDLLLKWNKSINLISKTTELDIWNRHIIDSAQLYKYIPQDAYVCDLGSGAGLPGIILSIIGIKKVTLIESDIRKCAFLHQASLLSDNNVKIINKRIENCVDYIDFPVDIITSRALDNVSNLLSYNEIFTPTYGFLLHKGKSFQKELAEAKKNWHFEFTNFSSKTSSEAVILEIKNVHQKN